MREVLPGYQISWKPDPKFGFNKSILAGGAEDIIIEGGDAYFPASEEVTTVKSSSAADSASGTGARSVTVDGLDSSGAQITETKDLNGTSLVTFDARFFRVNFVRVITAGSGLFNKGNIDVLHGTNILARIGRINGVGVNQTLKSAYTVPAFETTGDPVTAAVVSDWGVTVGETKANSYATMAILARAPGEAWQIKEVHPFGNGFSHRIYQLWEEYAPLTDLRIRCLEASDKMSISAVFGILPVT